MQAETAIQVHSSAALMFKWLVTYDGTTTKCGDAMDTDRHSYTFKPWNHDLWPFGSSHNNIALCMHHSACTSMMMRIKTDFYTAVVSPASVAQVTETVYTNRDGQTDRQTSDAHHCLMPALWGRGHNKQVCHHSISPFSLTPSYQAYTPCLSGYSIVPAYKRDQLVHSRGE